MEAMIAYQGPLVFGMDSSKWQGKLPLQALWARGVRFIYLKITHGSAGVDSVFLDNWKALLAFRSPEGETFRIGVYGWFVPRADPLVQADLLCTTLERAGFVRTNLPVTGDFEEVDDVVRGVALRDRYIVYRDRIRSNLGRKVMNYTAKWYFDLVLKGVDCSMLSDDDLWNAWYPNFGKLGPQAYEQAMATIANLTPTPPQPWVNAGKREKFRQFDGTGGLVMPNGVDADFDVWLGDLPSLDAWSESTWDAIIKDAGGTFGNNSPAHALGVADREERDAEELEKASILSALDDPPDTLPGTQAAKDRKSSSQRMQAVDVPIKKD